jgi:hypothetical protein
MRIKPKAKPKPAAKKPRSKTAGIDRRFLMRSAKQTSLIVTPWFRKYLRENKGLITAFLKARRELHKGKAMAFSEGKVTLAFHDDPNASASAHLYKLALGKDIFFIKEQREGKNRHKFKAHLDVADKQIQALQKAKKLLKGNPDFEVANYHMGWTSGHNSFLVTEHYHGQLVEHMRPSQGWIDHKFKPTKMKLLEAGLEDFGVHNLIYDAERKKCIIIDLRLASHY